jgi:hypothetical protein
MSTTRGNVPHRLLQFGINDMDQPARGVFEKEIEGGNFLKGGQSILLFGEDSAELAEQWIACLTVGQFPAYLTTPREIIRRMKAKKIMRDSDERAAMFDAAECLAIRDFFSTESRMTKGDTSLFVWFLKEAIRDGIVLIIAATEDDDLNYHGEEIGTVIEQHLEVLHYGAKPKTKKRIKPQASNS